MRDIRKILAEEYAKKNTLFRLMAEEVVDEDEFDEDDESYYRENMISPCCGASIIPGTDFCSDCKEHTGIDNT